MKGIYGRLWAAVVVLLAGCTHSPPQTAATALSQTRLQLGMEYLARNNLAAARDNLQKAEQVAPDDYRIQLGMALYERRIGENQAAERRYRHLLQRMPENGSVLNNYGAFLCSLGQYVEAQRQFVAVLQLSDYNQVAEATENAGYCFLNAGHPDEARRWLGQALKRDPSKGTRLLAEAESRLDAGQHEQALLLLKVYQAGLSATEESLWLQIRFAALANHHDEVKRYGALLARSFPQSKQYQQFLANEY
ncbi:type IV pilus biogenesis/stability protein PilW [Musicola paradisiaca]|uniref:Type IV pilus biogenesis/stability protein PilW n=1 Tax=Musicola paradisiaca (strain Ech703) TaxID=579405 RepID=C6CAL8_MUSP7|nr:type IV pilus biogenesis/stability protein PilW [Musicola paradisiaca]ACS86516.1 type IV pilus biogenesis/stability protein PilW [Musicola paradisiaca Ech703]